MDLETKLREDEKYEPSIWIRLAWWFGIYLGPQLPFALYSPAVLLAFPVGLFTLFWSIPWIKFLFDHQSDAWVIGISYGFYLVHLMLSLSIRRKKIFRLLIIILIVAVAFNLGGCGTILYRVKGIN